MIQIYNTMGSTKIICIYMNSWEYDNHDQRHRHSLIVRRSFLQKVDSRSRARLNCPLLSASSNRRSEGSERAATSPTGRRPTAAGPSGPPRLSKHIGPAAQSSLAEDRTRARVVEDCLPAGSGARLRPASWTSLHATICHVLIHTSRLRNLGCYSTNKLLSSLSVVTYVVV